MANPFTPDQLNQMATAMAAVLHHFQQQNPLPAPAPAPAPAAPTPKTIAAKPREYAGGADYLDFRRELYLYIAANLRSFPNDSDRIIFILSYLKGGHATTWTQNYMDIFMANQVFNPTETIAEFLEKLDKAFKDPNLVEKAITEFQADHINDEFTEGIQHIPPVFPSGPSSVMDDEDLQK